MAPEIEKKYNHKATISFTYSEALTKEKLQSFLEQGLGDPKVESLTATTQTTAETGADVGAKEIKIPPTVASLKTY